MTAKSRSTYLKELREAGQVDIAYTSYMSSWTMLAPLSTTKSIVKSVLKSRYHFSFLYAKAAGVAHRMLAFITRSLLKIVLI